MVKTYAWIFALCLVGSSAVRKALHELFDAEMTANTSAGSCTGFPSRKIVACSYEDCSATCNANARASSMGLCSDTHLKGVGVQYLCDLDDTESPADACIVWIAKSKANVLQTLVSNGARGSASRLMNNFVRKCTPAELTAMDESKTCSLINYYKGFNFEIPEDEQTMMNDYGCGAYYPKMRHA